MGNNIWSRCKHPHHDRSPEITRSSTNANAGGSTTATLSVASRKKLESFFSTYQQQQQDDDHTYTTTTTTQTTPDNNDGAFIGPDGMEHLCDDLDVDPTDISLLVLAWHLNAKHMGYFTKKEFFEGMIGLGVDTIFLLKSKLPEFRNELADPVIFKRVYRYAFYFSKEEDSKVLDLSTAEQMLGLLLDGKSCFIEHFRKFLCTQTSYKCMNIDQWMSFLEFSATIQEDLSDYDESSAWPVLLDEFVSWMKDSVELK